MAFEKEEEDKTKVLKPIPSDYQWACMVAPNYGTWALGYVAGDTISDIRAYIERLPSGGWFWKVLDSNYQGGGPSKDHAMRKVKLQPATLSKRKNL